MSAILQLFQQIVGSTDTSASKGSVQNQGSSSDEFHELFVQLMNDSEQGLKIQNELSKLIVNQKQSNISDSSPKKELTGELLESFKLNIAQRILSESSEKKNFLQV